MVFSSIPAPYNLDPSNWKQHQSHQIVVGSTTANPPPQPELPRPVSDSSHGSIRPGSMAERARLANIPVLESALKCPRCDSVNTKFCYFNNYSLSQPRHFCKTCRRYWTRGGALRTVPVGGGCRRSKRSKPASSKSPAGSDRPQASSSSTTSNNISSNSDPMPLLPPPRFTSPMNQLAGNFSTNHMGLNHTTISASAADTDDMNFQLGSIFGGVAASISSSGGGIVPSRLQQFPFLGGLDPSPPEMYHLIQASATRPRLSSSILTQTGSIETEENLEVKEQLTEETMPRIKDNQWIKGSNSSSWTHELPNYFRISTSN